MSNKKIAWEKWEAQESQPVDFFGFNDEESEHEENTHMKLIQQHLLEPFDMVSTPVGFFHQEDINRPDIVFDCWIGHTNFEITYPIQDSIEKIEGVEMLVILSRYRFLIGIGKLFSFSGWGGVREKIEKCVTGVDASEEKISLNQQTKEIIEEIKLQLEHYNQWAIFVFPNGEYDYVSADEPNDKDYLKKVNTFKLAGEMTGGTFISSEEEDGRV